MTSLEFAGSATIAIGQLAAVESDRRRVIGGDGVVSHEARDELACGLCEIDADVGARRFIGEPRVTDDLLARDHLDRAPLGARRGESRRPAPRPGYVADRLVEQRSFRRRRPNR